MCTGRDVSKRRTHRTREALRHNIALHSSQSCILLLVKTKPQVCANNRTNFSAVSVEYARVVEAISTSVRWRRSLAPCCSPLSWRFSSLGSQPCRTPDVVTRSVTPTSPEPPTPNTRVQATFRPIVARLFCL